MNQCEECEIKTPTTETKFKFYENLKKIYGIDREELKNYEWVGGYYPCIHEDMPLIDTTEAVRQQNRFNQIFPNRDFPKYETQCVCETKIINNAYIAKDEDYDTIIVVGCRCIRKFVGKMLNTRKCPSCGEKHKCKTEFCVKCKKINR
jgi:hypothetical protein